MHDLTPFFEAARKADILPPGEYEPLSIFPPNYEPEAKIDLGHSQKKLMTIRKTLAKGFNGTNTSVLRDTINPGGKAMLNMIVEPYSGKDEIPRFLKDGKFMRIAGRVDENGMLYDVKIALKSLSSAVEVINGLPFRQEFDRRLPEGLSLEDGFKHWLREYEDEYRTAQYSDLTFDQLRPTSAYMSARTGFIFLNDLSDSPITLVNEACEDLYLPVGPDLCTALGLVRNCEAQFEWETIGALTNTPPKKSLNQQEKNELGLSSMRNLLRGLIQQIYSGPDWESYTVTASKAEVSRQRTLSNQSFMWVNDESFSDSYDQASNLAYTSLLRNQRSVQNLLRDDGVRKSLCRFARNMERTRIDYNSKAPKEIMFDPSITLDA